MESKENIRIKLSKLNGGDSEDWFDSIEHLLRYATEQNPYFLEELLKRLEQSGLRIPKTVMTPYVNTIPVDEEPEYPGNRELERRIKSYVRWNAMAMVVKANRVHNGLGGHISTYASFLQFMFPLFNCIIMFTQ